jgi:hypothetical protein
VRSLAITREINVTRWLEPGEYVWDEDAAATATGPATVVVNLRSRTLSVYRGGVEIGRSSALYGYGEHPTPLGTFKVLQKKKDHISNIYNAPMPHMLRLTNDGWRCTGARTWRTMRRRTAASGCRRNLRAAVRAGAGGRPGGDLEREGFRVAAAAAVG